VDIRGSGLRDLTGTEGFLRALLPLLQTSTSHFWGEERAPEVKVLCGRALLVAVRQGLSEFEVDCDLLRWFVLLSADIERGRRRR
jgi:hypothetical protein